jgi:hypothetical protein
VTRDDPNEWISISGMWQQLECGEQPGGYEKRLRDRGIANSLGVRLGPVVPQIEARYRREPIEAVGEGG